MTSNLVNAKNKITKRKEETRMKKTKKLQRHKIKRDPKDYNQDKNIGIYIKKN